MAETLRFTSVHVAINTAPPVAYSRKPNSAHSSNSGETQPPGWATTAEDDIPLDPDAPLRQAPAPE